MNEFPNGPGLEYIRGVILGQYIQYSQFEEAVIFFKKLDPGSFSSYPVFNSIKNNVKSNSENITLLNQILDSIIKACRLELKMPSR